MRIATSTDNKYLGKEIDPPVIGAIINLDGFQFEVQFIHPLENGNVCVGNTNYQFEIKE